MTVPLIELTPEIESARERWQFNGRTRPRFAEEPAEGQESVWDYPRPPVIEEVDALLLVKTNDDVIAQTTRGKRVLETAGAPTYYFHPDDVFVDLEVEEGSSLCEWKGVAESLAIDGIAGVAWHYVQMFPEFEELYRWVSFYPSKVDCYIGEELVRPQAGAYYGGWVTENLVGPIKGGVGSQNW